MVSMTALAQSYSLSGQVLDQNSQPVFGAKIRNENFENVATTDAQGKFTIHNLNKNKNTFQIIFQNEIFAVYSVNLQNNSTEVKPWKIDTSPAKIEEVTITGKKKQKPRIATLPSEIVNQEFIQKNIGGSLMQTLERLPGVNSLSIGSSNSKPIIRGLGFNEIAVVENGIKHEGQQWGADHGLEIDQYNAENVEVIKGPASFIFGSDALGGVININSIRTPLPNTFGGTISVVGKSNNQLLGGSLNIYQRKSNWFYSLRSTYMDHGDYRVPTEYVYPYTYAVKLYKNQIRNTAGKSLNNSATVGYKSTDFSTALFMSLVQDKGGFFANAHGLEPRNVNTVLHDASDRDIQLPSDQVLHAKVISKTEWKIGKHHLNLDVAFQKNERQEYSQYVSHGYMPSTYPVWMRYSPELELQFNKTTYTTDLRDEIQLGNHQLTIGGNAEVQENKIGGWSYLIPSFRYTKVAGFIFDEFHINPNWTVLGALRYDFGQINSYRYRDWFPSDVHENGNTVKRFIERASSFSNNYKNISWSAGVRYTKENLLLTLNIGKSFRMPLAQELAANGVNYHYFRYEKGNKNLNPEQSYQIDLSGEWKNEKLSVKVSPYGNYFSNFIYLNPTAEFDMYYGAGNQVFNYTEAEVLRLGAELELSYKVTEDLKIETLGEYIYQRQLSGPKKNFTLPFSVAPSVLSSVNYEPLSSLLFIEKPYITIDHKFTAAQNQIVPPEKPTPASHVFGLSLGGTFRCGSQPINVNFGIRNIFDTKYFNHASFYRLIGLPEPGRNFILSLSVPFGSERT